MSPRRTHLVSSCLSLALLAACTDKQAPGQTEGDTSSSGGASETAGGATNGDESGGVATGSVATGSVTTGSATTGSVTTGSATTGSATTGGATTGGATTGGTTGGPPGELLCPTSIDAAILACVAELQQDPELSEDLFLIDLLLMCGDAEPVADDYDDHCAAHPDDPICSLEYETFFVEVAPQCVARAQEVLFADVCLLPESYSDLLFVPGIALMERRFVTEAAALDADEVKQVLWASADMGFPVDSVEEALLATDDDGFELLKVLEVGSRREVVAYTAHYGDTRVGRLFFGASLLVAGAVEDSFFTRCALERREVGSTCEDDLGCAGGLDCVGVVTGMGGVVVAPGVCVSPEFLPGEGDGCDVHEDCGPGSGLLCLDALSGIPGRCRPGWMRRSFAGPFTPLVQGGTATVPLVASGLATVPDAGYLDLQLAQEAANAVAVRLVNPHATNIVIADSAETTVILDLQPVKTPSDELANGNWQLVVEDVGGGASGGLARVALMLDTRWD